MATTKSTTTDTPKEETPATPVSVVDVDRPVLPAEDYLREQEKGGTDPVSEPVEPTKAEVVTVAPGEPYPSGSPATPAVENVPHNEAPPADGGDAA